MLAMTWQLGGFGHRGWGWETLQPLWPRVRRFIKNKNLQSDGDMIQPSQCRVSTQRDGKQGPGKIFAYPRLVQRDTQQPKGGRSPRAHQGMEGKRKRGLSICTVEYYAATAGNEVSAQAATCKKLEPLMWSEISQSHKAKPV